MAFGLQVLNTSSLEVIDGTYSNLSVVASGVVASNTGFSSIPGYVANSGRILMVRPSSGSGSIYGSLASGAGLTLVCSSGNINYIWIEKSVVNTTSGFGIQVYDSSGATGTFNSNDKVFSGDARISIAVNAGIITANTITLPAPEFGLRYFTVPIMVNAFVFFGSTAQKRIMHPVITLDSETSISYGTGGAYVVDIPGNVTTTRTVVVETFTGFIRL